MTGQLTIFDSMVEVLNGQVQKYEHSIQELNEKNIDARTEILSTQKYLAETDDWHDRKDYEGDIRYCEEQIEKNNQQISNYKKHILELKKQIQEYTELQIALKETNHRHKPR